MDNNSDVRTVAWQQDALDEKTLEAAATAYGVGVNLFQLADAIRSYLRICPSQVAPANPAQVTELAADKIPTWPPLKKALWDVVTFEQLNDGHYINAYDLTDKLYFAITAAIGAGRSSEPEFETAPDNGTPAEVLGYVLDCARRWVPEARIIGNARAGDIERAIAAIGAGGHAVTEPIGFVDRHRQKFASAEKHDADILQKSGWTPVYSHPADERVVEALELIRWAYNTLYEINPSNYDHDEVCKLNNASVEVILAFAQTLGDRCGKSDAWWADYNKAHPVVLSAREGR